MDLFKTACMIALLGAITIIFMGLCTDRKDLQYIGISVFFIYTTLMLITAISMMVGGI